MWQTCKFGRRLINIYSTQGVILDGSPRFSIPLTAMSKIVQGEYHGVAQKPVSFKAKADRPPLWIVLDEVQDPQVSTKITASISLPITLL